MKPVPRQGAPAWGWTVDFDLINTIREEAAREDPPCMEDIEWVILELAERGDVQVGDC